MTLPATTAGERRGVHTSYALLGNRSALGSRRPGHRLGVVPVGPPSALAAGQSEGPRQSGEKSAAKGIIEAGARKPRHNAPLLLLLALEAGNEHLLGPLGSLQVILEHGAEEIHELLVALRLSILDVSLERLYVI